MGDCSCTSLQEQAVYSAMQQPYYNPVLPGFYPDPSIIRVDDDYYLVTSTFEYYPGLPIFHSRDLLSWELIGHALHRAEQLDLSSRGSSRGLFAPTIRYHEGAYYVIVTDVDGIGNFYVSASHPAGPWSDPIRIPYGGIDPSIMFDEDGKVYITVQTGADEHSHIIQYEIDIRTGKALNEPIAIFHGDEGPWVEGPHLYRIGDLYYVMTASGGTGDRHREIIGRSKQPYGPYEMLPHPILSHADLKGHPIQNTGHADLVEDREGNWWAVFLGVRPVEGKYSILGRETFLAPVRWRDGWPLIDVNEGTVGLLMDSGDTLRGRRPSLSFRDDFNDSRLSLRWTFLRNRPDAERMSVLSGGGLRLVGSALALGDAAPAVFVCRRQRNVCMSASTELSFLPQAEGEEAGMAARLSDEAFVAIGVASRRGCRVITASTAHQGAIETKISAVIPGEGAVKLQIESDDRDYVLRYSADGQDWQEAARHPAMLLSPESNWCFTGVCIGLYATGNGTDCATPADYRYYDYQDLDEGVR
jgi:xylan 1,4-beta-xylosidase